MSAEIPSANEGRRTPPARSAAPDLSPPILDRLLESRIVPLAAKLAAVESCLRELEETRIVDLAGRLQLEARLRAVLKILRSEEKSREAAATAG